VTFRRAAAGFGVRFDAGRPYVLLDTNVRQFSRLRSSPDGSFHALADFQSASLDGHMRPYRWPAEAESVLILRTGGLGDLLMLTPVLRALRERLPTAHLGVCAFPVFLPILRDNPHVDALLPYPLPLDEFDRWAAHVDMEDAIENNPEAERLHATDAMAARFGLDLGDSPEAHRTVLEVTPEDAKRAAQESGFRKGPRERWVGLHFRSSSKARDYPAEWLAPVGAALAMSGDKVFVVGARGESVAFRRVEKDRKGRDMDTVMAPPSGFFDTTGWFSHVKHAAAFARQFDAMVCSDSAWSHIAGALGIRALALYGPFPGDLRARYYPSVEIMQGGECCNPFFHGRDVECKRGPGAGGLHYCRAFDTIPPQRLLDRVREVLAEAVAERNRVPSGARAEAGGGDKPKQAPASPPAEANGFTAP
jgi:ADP-heptose:LPS heptosyltransferase